MFAQVPHKRIVIPGDLVPGFFQDLTTAGIVGSVATHYEVMAEFATVRALRKRDPRNPLAQDFTPSDPNPSVIPAHTRDRRMQVIVRHRWIPHADLSCNAAYIAFEINHADVSVPAHTHFALVEDHILKGIPCAVGRLRIQA